MEKEIKIIVADTNWWISLIIKKFNNRFATILLSPGLKFVISEELTEEIRSTLSKERLQIVWIMKQSTDSGTSTK